MGVGDRIVAGISAWLRRRSPPSSGSLAEFDSDPGRFSRSPWIRSLIASPAFVANVPIEPCDVLDISSPCKRSGRQFLRDLLRLERSIRWGSPGLFTAMGDDLLRVIYREEFERLVAELREPTTPETLPPGGAATVAAVQQAANAAIDAARRATR